MGNQRQIIQVRPRRGLGVILRVTPGSTPAVRSLLDASAEKFYMYLVPAGQPTEITNLDGPDEKVEGMTGDHVVIQSGGKMWCGYEAFVARVAEIARLVEDAAFLVGDELDYIDEFQIRSGTLSYQRVHAGGWWPLDDYLAKLPQTGH